jgi:hypothetical protein
MVLDAQSHAHHTLGPANPHSPPMMSAIKGQARDGHKGGGGGASKQAGVGVKDCHSRTRAGAARVVQRGDRWPGEEILVKTSQRLGNSPRHHDIPCVFYG